MKYIRYSVRTVPDAEDIIISEMYEIGLTGAEIVDKVPLSAAEKEQIYTYDIDDPVDDGVASVRFYVEVPEEDIGADGSTSSDMSTGDETFGMNDAGSAGETDPETMRLMMLDKLEEISSYMDIGEGTVTVDILDDKEWRDNWKQFFHKFTIDASSEGTGRCNILVVPSWEEISGDDKEDSDYVLHIDPGTAFGTGRHETTQLALTAIRRCIRGGESFLDIGTGSGVLSILAKMFGAGRVAATDLDPFTRDAVRDNTNANGLREDDISLVLGNLIDDKAAQGKVLDICPAYDVVVANILPVVLKPLTPVVPLFMKKDGIYITSGILTEVADEMKSVLKDSGFDVMDMLVKGEWCAIISRKV